MTAKITLEEIQKHRYSRGAIVFNTNNQIYAIVLNSKKGEDSDPCSLVMDICTDELLLHTPPNRALIPTRQFYNLERLKEAINEF